MTVKEIFDEGAAQYDAQRRKVIPCFDDLYDTAIELIPFKGEETFTALDLGAGTGLLTSLTLKKFSKAQLTVVDISEKMLEKARQTPDEYRDLIVRVAGYSDYFVDLTEELQEEIIRRTGHDGF